MFAVCAFATLSSSSVVYGQSSPFTLENDLGGILTLEGFSATGVGSIDPGFVNTQPVSQITFAPGVNDQVYVSTSRNGIFRFDYDPTSSNPLTNGIVAVDPNITGSGNSNLPSNGSLGLAFHQGSDGLTSAYLAPSVGFNGTRDFDDESADYGIVSQSIFRITDNDGDGLFGIGAGSSDQSVAIVDNIRSTTLHQVNQLQVLNDTLFVNIGSSTENGTEATPPAGNALGNTPGESQYTGTLSFIEDLNAVGDTTNAAGFDYVNAGNATDLNNGNDELDPFEIDDAAARSDTQAFTSTDADKLRIYATGFRNNYGLAIRDDGAIFIGENEENGTGREDQLNEVSFQSDHGFGKENDLLDFRTDADLQAAGFFGGDEGGIGVGISSSAVGLAFLGADAGAFADDVLLSRFQFGDVALVDPVTGQTIQILDNVEQGLDIVEDPFGNYLVTNGAGSIQVLAVNGISTAVPEPSSGLLLLSVSGLLLARRNRRKA